MNSKWASGRLANWDRFDDLGRIDVPTLVIGAQHDTMDPAYMQAMAEKLPKGRYLYLPRTATDTGSGIAPEAVTTIEARYFRRPDQSISRCFLNGRRPGFFQSRPACGTHGLRCSPWT